MSTIMVGDDELGSPAFNVWFKNSRILADGKPAIVYHQTSQENVESIYQTGFDVKRVKAREFDEQMPNGIFFKPTDQDIGVSGKDRPVQLPYVLSVQHPYYVADRWSLNRFLEYDPSYNDVATRYRRCNEMLRKTSDKMFNDMTRLSREETRTAHLVLKDKLDHLFARGDIMLRKLAFEARKLATAYIQSRGHDGLVMERDQGGAFGNRVTKTIVVFEPSQARRVRFIW